MHSRTVETVLDALREATGSVTCAGWLLTHDLPIPDCHETLAERGLATGADLLWYVEEDMLPPPDALTRLMQRQRETGAGIVLMDYPVGEHPTHSTITRQPNGTILYGGLGCTLITREALERIPRPWFDTSRLWLYQRGELTAMDDTPYRYGGQDVNFHIKAAQHGVTIAAVTGSTAGHARLRAYGEAGSNHGAHHIDILSTIETRG